MPIRLRIDRAAAMRRLVGARGNAIAELERTMLREMDRTRSYAIQNRMATDPGPPSELLHIRSGRLRNSIFAAARSSGSSVTGVLGAGVPYAGVHERGGTVSVPSHARRQTMAWGREIDPVTVMVRAHSATYPQRAFLRPSLEARRMEILAALGATIRGMFP